MRLVILPARISKKCFNMLGTIDNRATHIEEKDEKTAP